MIRPCTVADAAAICEIYNPYILNTIITFEKDPVTAAEMAQRIANVTAGYPWLVYETGSRVAGYAYAAPWAPRWGYRLSAESSAYLDDAVKGRGIGSALYSALLEKVEVLGVHMLMGGIALPNEPSVRLHEKFGFKKVAHFPEIGRKFERCIDVGYWARQVA